MSGRWGLLVPMLVLGMAPRQHAPVAESEYERVFDELRRISARPDRVATVNDLVLRRDAIEFRLSTGTLYLLSSVAGQSVGAAFLGTGSVTFTTPLAVEGRALRRILKDSLLDAPVTSLVLFFADSTLGELERRLQFRPGEVASEVSGAVSDALGYLTDGGEKWADPTLMAAVLNADTNGLFYAYIRRRRGEHVMYQFDPTQVEEVALLRRGKRTGQRTQTVSQFERSVDLRDPVAAARQQSEPLQLDGYEIDATIKGDFGFSAMATVHFTGQRDAVRWVPLVLYAELEVDSVLDGAGAKAAFFRARRSSPLWVRLDSAIHRKQERDIRIVYHGDLIDRASLVERLVGRRPRNRPPPSDRWAFIKSTSTWFPRYSRRQAAPMHLTFHTPEDDRFAAIGKLVESQVERGVRTTRWTTELPTNHAGFNIGDFREFQITDPRIPPVTVHMNSEGHSQLSELLPGVRYAEREVGADVANSLSFFTEFFGPPLFKQYFATEIPYNHGQAFPGLIHLSWWTFHSSGETGWEEIFRAHEMAHQWWGIGVEPATDRDAWLSEGFAMFAGLWYMQMVLHDNDKYFKQLREWRGKIRGIGNDGPPIGLGYRVVETDPEDYDQIVYRKGAWVLHMLRNLMLDYRDMNEEAFFAMMKDFYTTYRGRRASTRDFQATVERHTRRPMDWFFDQWVDGTDVPTYTLSWRSEPAEGQYRLRLRVKQDGVPPSFTMPVPVSIEATNGERMIVRVEVKGPVTEAELKVPAEARAVELNPLESVLAEVKVAPWR